MTAQLGQLGCLLLLLSLSLPAQQPGAGLKLAAIPARDPSLLADAESKTYYLYTSAEAPAAGVVAYRSKNLAAWEGPLHIFQVPAGTWANPAQGAFDPEVHAYRGRYYLFVTLANGERIVKQPPESWRVNSMRGVQVFVSDSPQGPFAPIPQSADKPYTPEGFVAFDGTLYVEGDLAFLIYAHDWTQQVDANIEAVRLKADLSAPAEDALYLFKGSDAPWLREQTATSRDPRYYPAGGPFLYRTRNKNLVMIWSAPRDGKSAVALARSLTGKVRGPWVQGATLLADDSAQGSIFRTFDGRLMMLVRQPSEGADSRARLVELEDTGDTVRVKPRAAK
ncbi:MAG: family 43 glycosylhydrolase [Bryobacteraceae bacterium]